MTNLIHREGDLFTTDARAIGHGVNTVGVMGAGIAVQFKAMFPEMYEEYRDYCERKVFQPGQIMPWRVQTPWGHPAYVFNIASQEMPGANARYDYLIRGVEGALMLSDSYELGRLALPRIGSGIGGLDEKMVEAILSELASRHETDIELWTYKP